MSLDDNPITNKKVGFTGTSKGMTDAQKFTVAWLLSKSPKELHHGDCIGADKDAHELARTNLVRIVGHPPIKSSNRACCEFDEKREPKPYLDRNHDIVDETEVLIACTDSTVEAIRSGTWSTIRYARRLGRIILIVYPDGRINI
ncbi:MAG TPA: hypothetical protein VJ044_08205 [Candidatus Hodarchaeales archaeon]|nr:hypothetical protein [Candidatus Hodarchaeales archaeon]